MSPSCLYKMMLWGKISVGNMLVFVKVFLFLFFKRVCNTSLSQAVFCTSFCKKLFSCVISDSYPTRHSYLDKPAFAVGDYFPWEQWNNLYSAHPTSLGMICIRDRNIPLALCSRIASRKVLLVLNCFICRDKILQLPVSVGAGYMGGWQSHICSQPGFSSHLLH